MSAKVYAKWKLKSIPETLDLGSIHISCGAGEAQWDGFMSDDKGSEILLVVTKDDEWEIKYTAPALGLNDEFDYWLSPSLIADGTGSEIEAHEFGVIL